MCVWICNRWQSQTDYQQHDTLPQCPRCQQPLDSGEAALAYQIFPTEGNCQLSRALGSWSQSSQFVCLETLLDMMTGHRDCVCAWSWPQTGQTVAERRGSTVSGRTQFWLCSQVFLPHGQIVQQSQLDWDKATDSAKT